MIDRIPWDEADLKVKSLIYLSLGSEGTRTYHQRNPHSRIERCTANELVHELAITFTRPRNTTFDRFQCFKAMQRSNEFLETFYSRLRELGAQCRFGKLEEDLVTDIFISNMRSSNIQMELLSEVRTPQQALNYAINRKRGQANQQEILKPNTSWNTVSYVRQNKTRPQMAYTQQARPQTSYGQQKSSACWKCGNTFSISHLQTCPATQMQCKICKKAGHYTSLCTAKRPERRPPRGPTNNTNPQFKQQQTRRAKQIKQETEESDHTEESVDAEAALYIKELHKDWAKINIIRPMEFAQKRNDEINKDPYGEFWVETTKTQNKVQLLADTGSPRSFMNIDMAAKLQQEMPNVKLTEYTETTVYKIFTNNNIGSWTAKDCKVLIVEKKTNNINGRDILTKLEITLSAQKKPGKTINLI